MPPNWRERFWHGQKMDDTAQLIFGKLIPGAWVGQDELDPPGIPATPEQARDRDDFYLVLNILAETQLIAYRRAYAQVGNRPFATPTSVFCMTRFGRVFREWPPLLRRAYLAMAWLIRRYWRRIRQLAKIVAIALAIIKGWNGAWADVALAILVFLAILGPGSQVALPPTMDT